MNQYIQAIKFCFNIPFSMKYRQSNNSEGHIDNNKNKGLTI